MVNSDLRAALGVDRITGTPSHLTAFYLLTSENFSFPSVQTKSLFSSDIINTSHHILELHLPSDNSTSFISHPDIHLHVLILVKVL